MINNYYFISGIKLNIFLLFVVLTMHSRSQAADADKHLYCEDLELLISYNHGGILATSFNEPPEVLLPLIQEDAGLITIKDGLLYHQEESEPMNTKPQQTMQGKNLVYWSGPQGVYSYVLDHQGRIKILPRFVMVKDKDPIKFTVYHTDMVATNQALSVITARVSSRLAVQAKKEALALRIKNRETEIKKLQDSFDSPYVYFGHRGYKNPNYKNRPVMEKEIKEFDARTTAMQREIEDLEKNPQVFQKLFRYVASAGDIAIAHGKITKLSNQSGHLRTSPLQFALAVKQLDERNLLADDCQFEMLEASYESYVLDAGTSGAQSSPTYGKREKIITSKPTRQELVSMASNFLNTDKSSAHTTDALYGEKISCRAMPLDEKLSSFDVSKARQEGFSWGMLNDTQYKDVTERMVEFGDVGLLVDALIALDNDRARARLFNQLDLLNGALKYKSETIFRYVLGQPDRFLDLVLQPNIVPSIKPSHATLAFRLVGLAWQLMQMEKDKKVEPVVWRILDRGRSLPHVMPALEVLLDHMLALDYRAPEVMRLVDSFEGLRLLPRLATLMGHHTDRALALWQTYVEDNSQFKPLQKLCALKEKVVGSRPLDQSQLKEYNLLAQEIPSLLDLMVKLSKVTENKDLFLGYLIGLHGGSLQSYGNSLYGGSSFDKFTANLRSYGQEHIANYLVNATYVPSLRLTHIHQSEEKLSSYYLALSPERNPTLRLLGIYHLMEFLWPDQVYRNPPLGVSAQHKGLQTLEKNKQNRRQLFAAYKKLMDVKSYPSSGSGGLVIDIYHLLYPLGHAKSRGAYGHPRKQPLHFYIDHLINVLLYKPHLLRSSDLSDPYHYQQFINFHLDALVEDAQDYLEILEYALKRDPTYEKRYRYSWQDSYELSRYPRLIGQRDIEGYLKPPAFLDEQGDFWVTINKKTLDEAWIAYRNKKDHPLLFALGVLFNREKRK